MSSITQNGDNYTWVYEYNLWKKPGIFLLILKIFFFICLGFSVFTFISAIKHAVFIKALAETGKFFLIVFGIMTGLTLISYIIYSKMMGGKYIVVFEMNEEGITHTQLKEQYDKAQAMGLLTAAAGLAAGKPTVAGAGLLAASRSSMSSDFALVRSMKASKFSHTIKLNQPLSHNQVYTEKEDWDFVLGYIKEHLPNTAKIRE